MKIAILVTFLFSIIFFASNGIAKSHRDVRNCEIFVNQVQAYQSSHGIHGLRFYIKTINSRLDGSIKKVGFWHQTTSKKRRQFTPETSAWSAQIAKPFLGAHDYFIVEVYLGSAYEFISAEGVFFVQTNRGITYWLKPKANENYLVNDEMFRVVKNISWSIYRDFARVPTQNHHEFRSLNPDRCY